MFIGYLFITITSFLFSKIIIHLITGELNSNILYDFRIMLVVVLVGGLNYYLGVLGLVALKYNKDFSSAVLITGVLNVALVTVLSYYFNDIGASFSLVISESTLLALIILKVKAIQIKPERVEKQTTSW